VLLGLATLSGCSSTPNCGGGICGGGGGGFLSRLTGRSRVITTESPVGEGPMLGDPACGLPGGMPFSGGAPIQVVPQGGGGALPPLAPAPRLVPQAQPVPADPTSGSGPVKAILR
jgi:hypothetical protein